MLRFQYTYLLLAFWCSRFGGAVLLGHPLEPENHFFIGDARLVKEIIGTYSPRRFAVKIRAGFAGIPASGYWRWPTCANPEAWKGKPQRDRYHDRTRREQRACWRTTLNPTGSERAKQSIAKLIDKLGNDRIGIVVFRGKPTRKCRLPAIAAPPACTWHPLVRMPCLPRVP